MVAARGMIAGRRWMFELDSGRRGVGSAQAGRLVIGGRAYGFCQTTLDIELVDAGPHGIVYGLAAPPYRPPITIEATTARGTADRPARALSYRATTRPVPGAVVFLRALPASACAYQGVPAGSRRAIVAFLQELR